MPLGFNSCTNLIKYFIFSFNLSCQKDNLPTIECTNHCLSFLNSIFQANNSLMILSRSSQTVHAFGFGISHFGHNTFATFHIFFIIDGVAIAISKSIFQEETISIKSSHHAITAQASLSSFSFQESVNAHIFTVLPVPCGKEIVVLICCSLIFGSIQRLKCISIVGSNFTVFVLSKRSTASFTV
jgi:hypothetical protein